MKGRKQLVSLLMAMVIAVTCLPVFTTAATVIDLSKTATTILAPEATSQIMVDGAQPDNSLFLFCITKTTR